MWTFGIKFTFDLYNNIYGYDLLNYVVNSFINWFASIRCGERIHTMFSSIFGLLEIRGICSWALTQGGALKVTRVLLRERERKDKCHSLYNFKETRTRLDSPLNSQLFCLLILCFQENLIHNSYSTNFIAKMTQSTFY